MPPKRLQFPEGRVAKDHAQTQVRLPQRDLATIAGEGARVQALVDEHRDNLAIRTAGHVDNAERLTADIHDVDRGLDRHGY